MRTSEKVIKKMARLDILNTEPVKFRSEDDIIIKNDMDEERKVILDGVTDEDLPLLIALKQYETIKSIKSMIKFFLISSIIIGSIWLMSFLFELGKNIK